VRLDGLAGALLEGLPEGARAGAGARGPAGSAFLGTLKRDREELQLVEAPASFLEGVGLVVPARGGASDYAPLAVDRFVSAVQRPLEALEKNPGAARDITIVNPAVQALEDERKAKTRARQAGAGAGAGAEAGAGAVGGAGAARGAGEGSGAESGGGGAEEGGRKKDKKAKKAKKDKKDKKAKKAKKDKKDKKRERGEAPSSEGKKSKKSG